jgi:thiamine-phosphate pyrophosphorylase
LTTPDDIVRRAKAELSMPAVVIGGMTPANARPLVALGADMVAAITSVYLAPDPYAAAREFVGMLCGPGLKACGRPSMPYRR